MRVICFLCLVGSVLGLIGLADALAMSDTHPKERLAYWKATYGERLPTEDARAKRAHAIFHRVLRAAGTRPGVEPRLLMTQRDPFGIALPIAIPDGSIILSPKALALCYREPEWGDDRLAFVLGHEIAHQLKGDFWHVQFFQALEAAKADPPDATVVAWFHAMVRKLIGASVPQADEPGMVYAARELQADDYGIVYAAIAGFNTQAIVTADRTVNFFADWLRALAPGRLGLLRPSPLSPAQRAEAVKTRLRSILDQVEVFHWGVRFYQVGDYANAIPAFHHFLQAFPSPEVYHNVALSHHQLALRHGCMGARDRQALPFKLTLALDPETRASMISLLDAQRSHAEGHMAKAITFYQRARARDPSYGLVSSNLGGAFLQQGAVYKAIATLQDALALTPDAPEVHNHLGVAFFLAEQSEKARHHLHQARTLVPTYDAPLFNLGVMAYQEGRLAEAKRYWQAYLALDPTGPWADMIQPPRAHALPCAESEPAPVPSEHIMGLAVEAREHEIPLSWGVPSQATDFYLQAEPFKARQYPHGVITLSHLGELQMLGAVAGFKGTSTKGIAIGSAAEQVRERYGAPTRVLHMTHGASWVYDADGIAFQLRAGKVVSWLLY